MVFSMLVAGIAGCGEGSGSAPERLARYAEAQLAATSEQAQRYEFGAAQSTLDALERKINAEGWTVTLDEWMPKIEEARNSLRRHRADYESKLRAGWKFVDNKLISPAEQERIAKATQQEERARQEQEEAEGRERREAAQTEQRQRQLIREQAFRLLEIEYDKFKNETTVSTKQSALAATNRENGSTEIRFVASFEGESIDALKAPAAIGMGLVSMSAHGKYMDVDWELELFILADGQRFAVPCAFHKWDVGDYVGGRFLELAMFALEPDVVEQMISASDVELKLSTSEFRMSRKQQSELRLMREFLRP